MIFRLRNILFSAATTAAYVSVAAGKYSSSIPPKAHQLDDTYTFEQYIVHFDKSYTDPDEYDRRSNIFAKNLKKILSHNEGKNFTPEGKLIDKGFVMGVNMFTDLDSSEIPKGYNKMMHPAWRSQLKSSVTKFTKTERLLGETDTNTDTQAYRVQPSFEMEDVSVLPAEVDWTALGNVADAPNQGACGSCWAFAAAGTVESQLSIATGNPPVPLSQQNLLQCTPNPNHCGGSGGCQGSTVELALNFVADQTANNEGGIFTLSDLPYNSGSPVLEDCSQVGNGNSATVGITGWTQLEMNNYQATMNAVAKVGPLAIAMAASSWGYYEQGIWTDTADDANVDHAILLVGYGEENGQKYWKIRNSWGSSFGEDGGYIRVSRSDDDDNNCRDDTTPLEGTACALDDEGNKVDVQPVKVCGTGGILLDVAYPVGVHLIQD